jgi:dolichol-phosphate mannosyltransferase
MRLSLVIPAHNEEDVIDPTVRAFHERLAADRIPHEILVVNDNSSDGTERILQRLGATIPEVRYINNRPPHGFGFAVRAGLDAYGGDAVAIVMADASDRPDDLVRFYREMLRTGAGCVFGTRFARESRIYGYPRLKLFLNRLSNYFIRIVFGIRYSDVTNAFKLYRRETIDGLRPFLSHHFNLTVELPLKAIVRGYSYVVVPNDWINRTAGVSKLKIKEMGSRYLFIVLYCFIEKWLSKGDYRRLPVRADVTAIEQADSADSDPSTVSS